MTTLGLCKFGFTVDAEWKGEPGHWHVREIEALLRDGIPPVDVRIQQMIRTLRQKRSQASSRTMVIATDTIDEVISLLATAR